MTHTVYLKVNQIICILPILLISLSIMLQSCESEKIPQHHDMSETQIQGVVIPGIEYVTKESSGLLSEIQESYQSQNVVIVRPYWVSSENEYEYWIKVELLNPEFSEYEFDSVSRDIAVKVIDNIENVNDFDKIEISVVNKTGFIITFTTRYNQFIEIDSL